MAELAAALPALSSMLPAIGTEAGALTQNLPGLSSILGGIGSAGSGALGDLTSAANPISQILSTLAGPKQQQAPIVIPPKKGEGIQTTPVANAGTISPDTQLQARISNILGRTGSGEAAGASGLPPQLLALLKALTSNGSSI